MRIIEVIVSPTGESIVQTKGFAGSNCLLASKFIEDALGIAARDVKTAEYYGIAENQQQCLHQ
ncbi:MAG: DUF2997 domain-containing protein [Planctomycetota bacterium]